MLKGALVSLGAVFPVPSLIRFQYNPKELKREITPTLDKGGGKDRIEPARFSGAPKETISLTAVIDATDTLDSGGMVAQTMAKTMGIRPQLSALELFAYPNIIAVGLNIKRHNKGIIEAVGVPAARTLLIFGMTRIVPIRITKISVTEQLFDSMLNPIRAEVGLTMEAVTYTDVTNPLEALSVAFLAYQGVMEAQAAMFKAQEAMWALKQGAKLAAGAAKAIK